MFKMVNAFAPDLELKYSKFYIGLAKDGQPNNFVISRAKRAVFGNHRLRFFRWALIIVGWVLAIYFVAGLTAVIKTK
jgi:hypothetical protein